jgi:NhaA family Na+:H+ antiporter
MASAALGLIVANSPLAESYTTILHAKVAGLDLLHWVNDGLVALFFLLVGLEIKRELRAGELDTWPRRAAPTRSRARGHDRSGSNLLSNQRQNAGELARLGNSDRDRHRICARSLVAVGVEGSARAQSLPDLTCDYR